MNKNISFIWIACLLITTIAFFGLWKYEKSSQKDLLEICKIGVYGSLDAFINYRDIGMESDYIYALGKFNVFINASFLLDENTIQNKHAGEANHIYGIFVVSPEIGKSHINEIIEILDILKNDIGDFDAYMKMYDLRIKITHE